MKRMKQVVVLLMVVFCFCGCGQKIEDKVTLIEPKVAVGTTSNLSDLFKCEEGVSIGFNNLDSFDGNKVGSYSVEATITDGKDTVEKSFIIEVYDDESPAIALKKESISIYEGDKFEAKEYASVTDNSKEDIDIEIEDGVDTSKEGEYTVTYKATDSSGNSDEKQMSVIVKKTYSYSELKKLIKQIVKKKEYNKLEMDFDNNKKRIWVATKNPTTAQKGEENLFTYQPHWSIGIKSRRIDIKFFAYVYETNYDGYLTPTLFNLKSSTGSKRTTDYDRDINYTYDWFTVRYYNSITYLFKAEDSDKIATILSGEKIKLNGYSKEKNMKRACTKKEIEQLHQLSDFYNELSQYM